VKTVIIPEENVKDLAEISEAVKNHLEIVPASQLDDVLKIALVRAPEPISWDEAAESSPPVSGTEDSATGVTAH